MAMEAAGQEVATKMRTFVATGGGEEGGEKGGGKGGPQWGGRGGEQWVTPMGDPIMGPQWVTLKWDPNGIP